MLRRKTVICAVFFALAPVLNEAAAQTPANRVAEPFPSKQVRIVIPYTASGANDVLGRLMAQKLAERWKQPVIVENKPGAGSNIGMEIVAKSPPDGYTLLLTGSAYVSNPSLYKKLPFDPIKDFERITILATAPNLLVVQSSVPARSVKEVIELARASPGKLNYASSGTGSNGHLSMEAFKYMAGVNIQHIPYRGAGEAVNALIAGHVQLLFTAAGSIAQHFKNGRILPLGVTSLTRISSFPDVPSISEAGLAGFNVSSIFGVLAPGRTPAALIARLNGDFVQVLKLADVKERIADLGFEVVGSTPEEYTASTIAEIDKYAKAVKAAGIEPE